MERLYDIIQAFAAGSIVMAFIADYNRSALPYALVCLLFSIVTRLDEE